MVLRGYSGWNSRRAVQVLDQVFPKVFFFLSLTGRLVEPEYIYIVLIIVITHS
jgi:hypothetical protein